MIDSLLITMEESRFEVRPAGEKGKGLFALTQFTAGDVIFEEEPFVSCQFAWNEDYKYQACEYCLRPLEPALENARRLSMNQNLTIPYPEVSAVDVSKHVKCPSCHVKYCSIECQQSAVEKYHRTLCLMKMENDNTHPLEILKETWKQMHYPPETATIMLLAKIFAMVHQAENKDGILHLLNQFCHHTVVEEKELSHKLLGLKFSDQVDVLREALVHSVPTEFAQQWITPAGFLSLIALVGMNGQGIGTSSVSEWVNNVSKLNLSEGEKKSIDDFITKLYEDFENAVGDFLNNEGSGLYILQSNINHSCIPNAEITFPYGNHRLALKATKNINPEDEICISYLDECILERSRHSRQKILRTNYVFSCKCARCEQEMEHPDITSEEDTDDFDDEE